MRTTLNKAFTGLYTVAISLFLLLAFALVLTQAVGLVVAQPGWIEGASSTLLRPAIVTAVIAGILGFCVFNLKGGDETDDEEE